MTTTRIDLSFNKISRLTDTADLAEMLFPGNRNQQHAFLIVWTALKWADHRIVPNLMTVAEQHGISRRTLERVRAKMRRLGLIDHVSRFSAEFGYREGWALCTRFEWSLHQLAERVGHLRMTAIGSQDKDLLLVQLAAARREAVEQEESEVR